MNPTRSFVVGIVAVFALSCGGGEGDGEETNGETDDPTGVTATEPGSSSPSSTDGSEPGGPGSEGSSGSDPTTETGSDPPSEPGIRNTMVEPLPDGEPTACEWEWTIRTIHYHPSAVVPRRMYSASCELGPQAKMLTSLTLGENAAHPMEDPSSGALILSELDDGEGTLSAIDQRRFPECISMHGVAMSDDCQTIGALCRIPAATDGFDTDVLATHPAADWMTNPYVCGDRGMNDEMWLYEWTNGDIQSEPRKYIVHKSIGSWEYGNNYLRLGNDEQTWAIAVKATVGGENGPDTCHEADALLIMDRASESMTTRGWSWACGTGHTTFNRVAYSEASGLYAMLCSTDYNEAGTGGIGAYVFRREDGDAQEFHYMSLSGIQQKGGASSIVARDGGWLGVLVGVEEEATAGEIPETPGTRIGLARWDANGDMEGDINWMLSDDEGWLSYSTLAPLSADRFVLGWGVMRRLDEDLGDNSMRVPWEFWLMEIDADGTPLTDPLQVEGAGWGELDEMVPLGQGRAGWAYIADPALTAEAEHPDCNQDALQLSVYTSSDAE